jgi:hypothetical protein
MENELRPEHADRVSEFVEQNKNIRASYMLTIARDGESPVRSIYHFDNAIDAAQAYGRYTDWGFAKDFLTVSLYEPGGKNTTKVLKRPKAGECVFVKADYVEAEKILLSTKEHLPEENYTNLIKGFAGLFSRDNIRFDVSRFFKATQCEEVNE